MLDVEGFILVGGASSRMGDDKAGLLLDGQTTVAWIADSLRAVTTKIALVGSTTANQETPYPSISDQLQGWGPLGGIQAALRACAAEYCIVIACDLPFVTPRLFERLLSAASSEALVDAVVPRQKDGRAQPLCAVYRQSTCLAAAEKVIAANEHTPRAMLETVRTRFIEFTELANLPGSDHFFFNLNYPDDFARAREIAVNIRSTR